MSRTRAVHLVVDSGDHTRTVCKRAVDELVTPETILSGRGLIQAVKRLQANGKRLAQGCHYCLDCTNMVGVPIQPHRVKNVDAAP